MLLLDEAIIGIVDAQFSVAMPGMVTGVGRAVKANRFNRYGMDLSLGALPWPLACLWPDGTSTAPIPLRVLVCQCLCRGLATGAWVADPKTEL